MGPSPKHSICDSGPAPNKKNTDLMLRGLTLDLMHIKEHGKVPCAAIHLRVAGAVDAFAEGAILPILVRMGRLELPSRSTGF